jgi:hypothetical protein
MLRIALILALAVAPVALAGDLTPPGAPAPTMKTLDQVEPRMPIGPLTTPGDADSVFRINRPGSYYLTGEVFGRAGERGIEIAASDVSIDLMGYTVRGVAGSLEGIRAVIGGANTRVVNGVIRDWDGLGVDLLNGFNLAVSDLMIESNGAGGVALGQNGIATRCVVRNNDGDGLTIVFGGVAESVVSEANTGIGIAIGNDGVVRDSRSNGNLSYGYLGVQSVFDACVATANSDDGFLLIQSRMVDCLALGNSGNGVNGGDNAQVLDSVASGNGLNGILVGRHAMVARNLCERNGSLGVGAGVAVGGIRTTVEGNSAISNDIGIDVNSTNNFIAGNFASGNAVNYTVVADNMCLVVTGALGGAINGDAGGVSPGSTDPNANYAY